MKQFVLHAPYKPTGDQPQAIQELVDGLNQGHQHQVLLGATGTGKTFTMANIIEQTQRPALVIAHNKTLVAQLYAEFKEFFPENAVEYFISYYDYYQPEAYVPRHDLYIEKETDINEEIERLRLAATTSLLSRQDVIIVASVSCIYGLGNPEAYGKVVDQPQGRRIDPAQHACCAGWWRSTTHATTSTWLPALSGCAATPSTWCLLTRTSSATGSHSSGTRSSASWR